MNTNERYIDGVWPPLDWPFPFPEPRPPWDYAERSGGGVMATILAGDQSSELLKRLYARPDYRVLIQRYSIALAKRIEADPEAMAVYQELQRQSSGEERVAPLVIFLAGVAIGIAAEKMK